MGEKERRGGRAIAGEGGAAWGGRGGAAGYGIRNVDISREGGRTWVTATLGEDLGRFSFRAFRHAVRPSSAGAYVVMARATNRQGSSQTAELIFNPPGYHNNVMQRIAVNAA